MTVENGESGCVGPANGGINHVDSTPHARGNAANQAGSSFFLLPEATTYEQQLSRNLDFAVGVDEDGIGLANAIARAFGTKQRYLKSWAHHLTTVRNIAAHHDRFYNRVMNIRPLLLKRDSGYASYKQFPTLLIIKRIYERSWPGEWRELGKELSDCFDRHPKVDLSPMDLPSNWKSILGL